MFFSSGHVEHSPSSSKVENFSRNLQTQEASDGAVHHAGNALRRWTHDELHGYNSDLRMAYAGSGVLEFSGVKCP
jgi:hypothetical protein